LIQNFSFQPELMNDILDGQTRDVKRKVRQLLKDPVFSHEIIRDKEIQREKIMRQLKFLATQGLGSILYPTKYGGDDDPLKYAAVFEMIALYDLSLVVKFGVQFGLFGGSVHRLGTEAHHEKYLADIGNLDLTGCFAMTETDHGSNVKGLETTAVYLHDLRSIEVHSPTPGSAKEYIGNAIHAKLAVVFAQLYVSGINQGVHAVIVPVRDREGNLLPGVFIEDNGYKMGLNGVDNGIIRFDHVRVPRRNLLNQYGDINDEGAYVSPIENPSKRFFTMLGSLVAGRICVGLGAVAVSRKALTIAIRYALSRRQFSAGKDKPETLLMDYPTHQRRLLLRLSKTYAYGFGLKECANRYAKAIKEGSDLRYIETLAAGLKAAASWHATDTAQECREACGGKGYLSENALPDLKADSDIFTTFEGDNTVLLQLVAKSLLSDFRQEFHDEGYRAVMKFLAERLATTMMELNPVVTRRTDLDHLIDPDFQLHAFRYRYRRLLYTVGQRMQKYLRKRINPYDAFLRCQNHMVELAKAFTDYWVLKRFVGQVVKCDQPEVKQALKNMCDLYALSTIEEHKGWYLEQDYMQGSKTKAIRRVVNKLCQDIKVDARAYVDAFDIPEELLNAEILQSD
jgi:acyl-CoA oxidase